MKRLDGRVAIVTGGGSGFGRATALRLASEGAKVLVADVNEAGGRETLGHVRSSLGNEGTAPELYVGDIATREGAHDMAQRAAECFGPIDILVNNAGIAPRGEAGRTWDMPEEDWDEVIRINLKSIYLCSRAVLPGMLARRSGSIVNVASIAATRTCSSAAYAAAKSGILGYSLQVATEIAPHNVRVNSVSPGFMKTPMSSGERNGATPEEREQRFREMGSKVPMQRMGEADDIAAAIAYLASDDAKYVSGTEIIVDGAYVGN